MEKRFTNKKRFIFKPIGFIALVLLAALAVMHLWNYAIPGLIPGVGELVYSKALAILVLSKILFGGFRNCRNSHSHHNHPSKRYWKEKVSNMTEEEKLEFKKRWQNKCRKD